MRSAEGIQHLVRASDALGPDVYLIDTNTILCVCMHRVLASQSPVAARIPLAFA